MIVLMAVPVGSLGEVAAPLRTLDSV